MISKISTDTYFSIGGGVVLNKNIIFDGLSHGYEFYFPKLTEGYFINCSKSYLWYNLEPEKMPNIKHIFLDSNYDETIIYRFPRSTKVRYYISSEYFNHEYNTLSNIKILENGVIKKRIEEFKIVNLKLKD